jgi:hypothetical protein
MNIKKIVEKYLKENRCDGLCCPEICGCGLEDLMPCGEISFDCFPAKKIFCKDCDEEFCIREAEWELCNVSEDLKFCFKLIVDP